jgi:hypothetical protein
LIDTEYNRPNTNFRSRLLTMTQEQKEYCFGTLALGKVYRSLALVLAQDLEKYAPNTAFVVLTDKPEEFAHQRNILPFKHSQRLWCDNDKSLLIEKAFSLFNTCICIDADMRITAPLPSDLQWLPGITARSSTTLFKHHQKRIERGDLPNRKKEKEVELIRTVAEKVGVQIENENVKWIYEFLFVVTKDSGKEVEFLEVCKKIARYLELHGVTIGTGSAMGIAAAKVGMPVRRDEMEGIAFFDDRIEKTKISKGDADPNATLAYFETLAQLKRPQRSLPDKVAFKLSQRLNDLKRSCQLRLDTLSDPNFYYQ